MEYVPVIIPTLNRNVHLERCIESLKKSECADKTDLYISVDYPPSEKYEKGYDEVKDYVKTISGFRNVYIYVQEKNLDPINNFAFLVGKAREQHSSFFFTDDDNEYCENALDYVNAGLERFKEDKEIFAVCVNCYKKSYRSERSDFCLMDRCTQYGLGMTVKQYDRIKRCISNDMYERIWSSGRNIWKLLTRNPIGFFNMSSFIMGESPAMQDANGNATIMDYSMSIYCTMSNKLVFRPIKKHVRNWGADGSGAFTAVTSGNPLDVKITKIDISGISDQISKEDYKVEFNWLKEIEGIKIQSFIRAILVVYGRHFLNDRQFERFAEKIKKLGRGGKEN